MFLGARDRFELDQAGDSRRKWDADYGLLVPFVCAPPAERLVQRLVFVLIVLLGRVAVVTTRPDTSD